MACSQKSRFLFETGQNATNIHKHFRYTWFSEFESNILLSFRQEEYKLAYRYMYFPPNYRASDNSRKKSQISQDFGNKIAEKSVDFREFRWSFQGKLGQKAIGKQFFLWLLIFSGQISQEIDRFFADQTSVFNVFLTEDINCSFNNNTL